MHHTQLFSILISWQRYEAYIYNALFLLHQGALFYCIPPSLYADTSFYFSLIFWGVQICDTGFDITLYTFFPSFLITRYSTSLFFIINFLITLIPLTLYIAMIFPLACSYAPLLISIFIIETAKKILRSLIFLLQQPHICVFAEIIAFISYGAITWYNILCINPLTPRAIIAPLAITSSSTVLFLAYKASRLITTYQTNTPRCATHPWTVSRIVYHRCLDATITTIKSFLHPDAAFIGIYTFSPMSSLTTATIKFITLIMTTTGNILHKTLITPTKASLAHATTPEQKKAIIREIMKRNSFYTRITIIGTLILLSAIMVYEKQSIYCNALLVSLATFLNQTYFLFLIPIVMDHTRKHTNRIFIVVAWAVIASSTFLIRKTEASFSLSIPSYITVSACAFVLFSVAARYYQKKGAPDIPL